MIIIRICMNKELKTIQFWLSQDERHDNVIYDSIRKYSNQDIQDNKFKKIIYISGKKNITEQTGELLKYNRKCPSV